MHWQYNPYVLPLIIATAITGALAIFAWRRRATPGSMPFTLLMLAVATWSLSYAFELGGVDLSTKLFWVKIQYLSIVIVPIAWLAFVLQYIGRADWLTQSRLVFLSIMPILTVLVVWTNDSHALMITNIELDTSGSFPVLVRTFGSWFWINAAYAYSLLFLGSFLLIQTIIRNPQQYRKQSAALLIGALAPWVGNSIYIFGLSPLPSFLDPTTFLFTLSGIAFTWGVFRFRFLDIVPVAYHTVIKSMADSMLILDAQKRILDLNPAAERTIGQKASGVIGQPAEKVLSGWPDLLQRCVNTREEHGEIVLKRNGVKQHFDIQISRLHNHGRLSGHLVILRDITERKSSEDILAQSEERYRSLVENTLDGYFVCDYPSGRFLFVNQRACDLFNYPVQDVAKYTIWNMILPAEHTIIKERIEGKMNGSLPNSTRQILSAVQKDGSTFRAEISASLVTYQGKPVLQGVVRDVTEQERLEQHLKRAEKMEAIGTLAGGVAHDLNNILSGLVSYPELLLMDLPQESPLRKPLLTIQNSGERAATIVQDLLTLARRGVDTAKVMNLNDIISEYLDSPEHEKLKFYHPEVQVTTDLEADLLNIMGSPVHISKTIMNLVSNAVEAMPDGGKILITTENRYVDRPIKGYAHVKEGDYVTLAISDTGLGISPENMQRIFEPFFTKKVMGRSGTGLGMAVVWGTVKDHKGYIDVQSSEGKGTSFTVYFPVTRQELTEESSFFSIEDYMGKGESILIVDDVEEQREIASRILGKLGYFVTSVSCGEEAIAYIRSNPADLVILDMIMDPGIDGLDTFKRIIEIYPSQKAIIASGFSETHRVKEAQRLGAGSYVKKPYSLEKIGLAVRVELDR